MSVSAWQDEAGRRRAESSQLSGLKTRPSPSPSAGTDRELKQAELFSPDGQISHHLLGQLEEFVFGL